MGTGHLTRIDGTNYEVAGGITLIDGTGHDIDKGITLIDGTRRDILFNRELVPHDFDEEYYFKFTWNGGYSSSSNYTIEGTNEIPLPRSLRPDWSNCISTLEVTVSAWTWYYLIQNGQDKSHDSSTTSSFTLKQADIETLGSTGRWASDSSNTWVLTYYKSTHSLTGYHTDYRTGRSSTAYFQKVKFTWEA